MILTGLTGYACAQHSDGASAAASASPLSQILLEERNGPLPSELRRSLVIPRRRVVVEPVLRARVRVDLVAHPRFLQFLFVRGVHLVDARILFGEVDEQPRLDLRHRGCLGGGTIERYARLQVGA